MMRTRIIHPELLAGLARLGHGSRVLVADALFPHATGANPSAPRVQLNLTPGVVPALAGHRHWGGQQVSWDGLERFAFYDACQRPEVGLVIATGEVRPYANLLLTVGVP